MRAKWFQRIDLRALIPNRRFGSAVRAAVPCVLLLGCAAESLLPPDALPSRLELQEGGAGGSFAADLDRDGVDEIVAIYDNPTFPSRPILQHILIHNQPQGQRNIVGRIVGASALDTDGGGDLEVLIAFVRDDSLFVMSLDAAADPTFTIFVASGVPRVESEGTLPWDPKVIGFTMEDADGDGRDDLVTLVVTGFARLPRGIFVNRVPDGTPVASIVVGAGVVDPVIGDFDHDGVQEVAWTTAATNHGASAGGFDDSKAWFMAFELSPLHLTHQRELGHGGATLEAGDFDGDGRLELAIVTYLNDNGGARVEILDPATWRVERRRDFTTPLGMFSASGDTDRDGRPEILVATDDSVLLMNGDLEIVARNRIPGRVFLEDADDLDGDGRPEFVAFGNGRVLVLGSDLSVRAALDPRRRLVQRSVDMRFSDVIRRTPDRIPELAVYEVDGPKLYRLVPNRLWAFHRWGTNAARILVIGALGAGAAMSLRYRRRALRVEAFSAAGLDDSPDGLMRMGADGRVLWMNRTLRTWLGQPANGQVIPPALLATYGPELAGFCTGLAAIVPPRHTEAEGPLPAASGRHARYAAEPLRVRGRTTEWLVRVRDITEHRDLQEARTWTMLAQRVAHDLKSPLTSLLLTLQRLAMEYRSRVPDVAPAFEPYTERMEQRIEQLRRMTANFMKFVEADAPEPRDIVLNDLVNASANRIARGLAPDIQLVLRLDPAGPVVHVDPQQFESVLENLAANAVNAMPDGGTITITTGVHHGIRLTTASEPGDWAHIEVLDTGRGIPGDALELIFEAGYTLTENGTGVGLTIVRRIVERHGGRIDVESELDTGSAFSIHLPLICTDSEPRADAAVPAPGDAVEG